ncbi:MAG: ribonuclease Y [Bacilli bacterium]|nr:ribonuclease Y [Bacilli bacterium]
MQSVGLLLISTAVEVLIYVVSSILLLGIGFLLGLFFVRKKFMQAGKDAARLIEEATRKAEDNRKEVLLEVKKETYQLKQETEREIKERKKAVEALELKVEQREERLDSLTKSLEKRSEALSLKERKTEEKEAEIVKRSSKVEELISEQEKKLIEVSGLSVDEAKKQILERVEENIAYEIAGLIKDAEEKAKIEIKKKSQSLLANAIQQYANDVVNEKTVSTVNLPNDEMKGRIIGREGRNIRAIEASTGVDLIIDDTPEAVVISSFDPVRREVAKRTLEALIADGRIQPPRIEELVVKFNKELENEMKEAGEKAIFDIGIGKVHPELTKLVGRLKFRTSYGQNALTHSLEVAYLAGKLAVEIGENEHLARRAGLFHDIGKAVDHEMEGSHVDIGIELARRYRENNTVIDAIASHHGDKEATTVIALLVAAADTLSAARPGARSESLENYIKRLNQLEEICNEFKGVDKSYALQAGREIRILVKPEMINDVEAYKLARDIRLKIESNLSYPGTIKVTVIRETRAHEVAK